MLIDTPWLVVVNNMFDQLTIRKIILEEFLFLLMAEDLIDLILLE